MSADVAYLDTSAVVKLLVHERESTALRRSLRKWPRRASAALLRVELERAIRRAGLPRAASEMRRQLGSIHLLRLDDALLDRAARLEPATVRTLDAIHLAAALTLERDLGAIFTYDDRMAAGAAALGLTVTAPR